MRSNRSFLCLALAGCTEYGLGKADGVAHVAVTYEGGCSWLIGFEDLYGGGDFDYNDVVFRVQGLLIEQ